VQAASARIAFLGNDVWSVPSLEALAASHHEMVLVVTAAAKPAGRGSRPTPTAVATAASDLDLPLAEVETARSGAGFERLASSMPQILVVVAYGEILPATVLNVPTIVPVNLHFSLLPELRGASPVQHALLLGLERTGVTTMVMDEGLDTGPVVLQREERIDASDDAGTLGARLARVGADVLVETIDALVTGSAAPAPQDDSKATYAPKLRAEDRVLDWTDAATVLVDRCRALSPEPAATTTFRGKTLKVYRGDADRATGEPGTILAVTPEGPVVATADGGFRPLDVAPEGRRRMRGSDFVNGFRPQVGERLG
jgi:methionyl-tRNA formyltransferase